MNRNLKGSYDAKRTRIVATTRDVDRDGEVVDPRGVKNFETYLSRNPVILWQHKHDQAPIGKATGGEVKDDQIELDIEWAPTPMGKEVKALYDGGFMSSFSIGFVPTKSENKGGQFTWTDWELLEVSAVSIPANPMANVIRSAEARGLALPTLKGFTGKSWSYNDPDIIKMLDDIEREENQTEEQIMTNIEIQAMRDDLEMYRKEAQKRATESAKAQIREEDSESATIRVGTNPEYKGVNLRKGVERFAQARADRGDHEGAKMARADEEKSMSLMKAFHDLTSYADSTIGYRKDLTRGTTTEGGFLTSDDRDSLLSYARKASVALRRARIVKMSDNKMTIPREDAKLALGFTNETTEAVETSATFEEVTLDASDLDGYCDVSMHLEMDSETPIAALLLDQFTEAYGQNIDSAVFVSPGDPVSGLFLGGLGGSEVFGTGSTAFSEILASNLFNAIGALSKERRQGATWTVGTTALWTHLAQMQDGSGRYLMAGNWASGPDARLLGYPVDESYYAPDSAADTVMAVFGNMKGVTIGDRLTNLTLFRDPYSLSHQHYVRYVFWTRVAFAQAMPGNFVTIQTAAS